MAPQLDAQYPDNDASVYSLRPELLGTGHDPDTYPSVDVRYRFYLFKDAVTVDPIADSGLLPYGQRSWRPPANLLKWNTTYAWGVDVFDGTAGVAVFTRSFFTTTVPQPLVTSTLSQNPDKGFDPNIANYTTSETDADVSTHAPALAVSRAYNSRDPRVSGAFGAGWSTVYDMRAEEGRNAAGTLTGATITYPTGGQVGFGANPDGQLVPPLGRFATLIATKASGSAVIDGYGSRTRTGPCSCSRRTSSARTALARSRSPRSPTPATTR